jgi:hypothetical protein
MFGGADHKVHLSAANHYDFSRVFQAIAVEQANPVARARSANRGKMAPFRAIEN